MNNIDKQANKLFTRLLTNKTKRTYWDNISALRKIVTEEVFNRAFQLANSTIEKEKIIGIDILVQLGHTPRFRQKETLVLCFKLLDKNNLQRYCLLSCMELGITMKTLQSIKQINYVFLKIIQLVKFVKDLFLHY